MKNASIGVIWFLGRFEITRVPPLLLPPFAPATQRLEGRRFSQCTSPPPAWSMTVAFPFSTDVYCSGAPLPPGTGVIVLLHGIERFGVVVGPVGDEHTIRCLPWLCRVATVAESIRAAPRVPVL